ncbi:MAG TPA: DASH family cryptochrome, partial [Marinobacter hydrocarbonoclasticus]|nr:DASH family cryptochrome [Marinobacter nauticus]
MRTLYWFTRDLRLHDNPALLAAARSDMLLCVFVVDPRWFTGDRLQCRALGDHRWRFLWQSLMALERSLRPLGQRMHIAWGEPEIVLPELAREHGVQRLIRSRLPGTEEAAQWQALKTRLPEVTFQQFETLGMFTEGQLPMELAELPDTFSQFRKQVEKAEQPDHTLRIRTVSALPPPPGFPEDN